MKSLKVYGNAVDKSGASAWGIGLALVREEKDGVNPKKSVTLCTAVTNANGLFVLSCSIPQIIPLTETYIIRTSGKQDITLTDFEVDKLANVPEAGLWGPLSIILETKDVPRLGLAPAQLLPLTENEIAVVARNMPGLFVKPARAGGGNQCSPLSPASIPSRVFYFHHLTVLGMKEPPRADEPLLPFERLPIAKSLNPRLNMSSLTASNRTRVGIALDFRQEWWDIGMSLGSLLYSVPLAPCEEIKVAAVDWRRKDWAKRESAVDESHFQDTTISRDETVSEVVRMSSDKSATATTVGGGASLSIPDLNLALGGTVAQETLSEVTSSQAIASRGVNDRVRQASNTVRNTRAFSVAEVSQEEESVVRTKIIRNHNHCHTVTFQYFEVLQNYLLSTRVIRTRPVLFIPFEPLSFNVDTIAAHGYLIRRGLLDPSLASMFDEYLGLVKPAGESDAKDLGDTTTNVYGFEVSWRRDKNSTNHPEYIKLAVDGETLNFVSSTNNGSLGAETTVSFKPTVPLTLEKIDRIGCIYDLPGGITGDNKKFYSLEVRANLAMAGTPVYVTLAYWPKADFSTDDWVFQRIASERPIQIVTAIPLTPPKGFERLLAHLNANKFYYSCLIIAGGDAAFRYLMLQGYPSAKKPLVDMVLPEVVGYMGDMLAFPIRDLSLIPDNLIGGNPDIDREERLKEILAPKSDPDERVISLPTPGIFAESQLGLCSACEKIDDTRFWDWQKSPCPDSAPDINSQMLASRYQDTSPLVQFVQPSLKPEPVQIPELPKPMIEIGDNTLANLTKGLDLKNLKDVLDLVGGLVKAASDGFKSNADAVKDTPPSGGPGSGDTSSTDSADTGAADTGGLDASTAAAATPI